MTTATALSIARTKIVCRNSACQETPEVCDNGEDDDGDGFVDCWDADCVDSCDYREICDNQTDDDEDGFVDCDDQDCFRHQICIGGIEICDNRADDDNDGFIDCEDSDCFNSPGCEAMVESAATAKTTISMASLIAGI